MKSCIYKWNLQIIKIFSRPLNEMLQGGTRSQSNKRKTSLMVDVAALLPALYNTGLLSGVYTGFTVFLLLFFTYIIFINIFIFVGFKIPFFLYFFVVLCFKWHYNYLVYKFVYYYIIYYSILLFL